MASLIKRNGTSYIQWYEGKRIRRRSLRTTSRQIAKERLRESESAQLRGIANLLPTRTPIAEVLEKYAEHIRTVKTPKAAQTDIYYLREAFSPVCDELTITTRTMTGKVGMGNIPEICRRHYAALVPETMAEEVSTTRISLRSMLC